MQTTSMGTSPAEASVSGDLSQLLVGNESAYSSATGNDSRSVLPRQKLQPAELQRFRNTLSEMTVLKSKLRGSSETRPDPTEKNAIDMFNLNMDMMAGGRGLARPIEKAGKVTASQLRKSLGNLKKLPRARGTATMLTGKYARLPPPPVGMSVGHGLLSSRRSVGYQM